MIKNCKNNSICIMIVLFILAAALFIGTYIYHSKNIENRFDKALGNYVSNIQTIITNTIIDKNIVTNEYTNTITINNQLIIDEEIIKDLKATFNINTRMLESSMSEIMKNSNDILSFWFAFLSVIMIVFTFIGIFINNNILEQSKNQLHIVEYEANKLLEQIEIKTKKVIYENSKNIEINTLLNFANQAYNVEDYYTAIDYYNQCLLIIDNLLTQYDNKSEEYINYSKNYSTVCNNRGTAKNNLKLYEDAIEDYNKAIEFNPYNSLAFFNIGNTKNTLGKFEEAIENFDKAIKLNPNNSYFYNSKGNIKNTLGKFEEAIENFDKAKP